jgi:hypothetical protein
MGLCQDLTTWCDGIVDCPDGSDEFAGCNACEYLRATQSILRRTPLNRFLRTLTAVAYWFSFWVLFINDEWLLQDISTDFYSLFTLLYYQNEIEILTGINSVSLGLMRFALHKFYWFSVEGQLQQIGNRY